MDELQSNGPESSSSLQRLLIGAGTLLVVILTVIGAVLLAMQEAPEENSTPVAQASPTATGTPVQPPTATIAAQPPAIDTSTPLPSSFTPTPLPVEDTPLPATVTFTPTPLPPPPTATFTPTPAPVDIPTDTPVPPTAEPSLPQPGSCDPPANWVAYLVDVGDTLNSLGDRTNTSVNDLYTINCLDSFTIRPGDIIYLPFTPPPPTPTLEPPPAATRRPTATRTATPVLPRIDTVIVQLDFGANKVVVIVTGENFRSQEQGFRAELVGPTTIPLQLGAAKTTTNFEASAPLSSIAEGEYDLVVTNPTGRQGVKIGVFPPSDSTPTPTPAPPSITRVSPTSGKISVDVRLTVQGSNFLPKESGFKVELQKDDGTFTVDVSVDEDVRPATSTSFDVIIFSGTLPVGLYNLLVTNPNGQTDIERFAYEAVE